MSEYLADQAVFKDDKIRVFSDKLIKKLFPKSSYQYRILRSLLIIGYRVIKR